MSSVEFEEFNRPSAGGEGAYSVGSEKSKSKMATFLMKIGLAKNQKIAQAYLLVFAVICFVSAIFVFIYFNFDFSQNSQSNPSAPKDPVITGEQAQFDNPLQNYSN